MLRIFHDTNFDFINWWRMGRRLTAAFILARSRLASLIKRR